MSPRRTIPRVAPKAYGYAKAVLDFGFHNAHSVGMTALGTISESPGLSLIE